MPVRIHPAGPEDIPLLVDLMTEFYAESGYPLAASAATRLFGDVLGDRRLGTIWLVSDGADIAGYAVVVFSYSMEFAGLRGYLDDFFVRPAARNRGLGMAALEHIRAACKAQGVKVLLVETGPDDHPAQRLYRRAGFADIGRVFLSQPLAPPVHEELPDALSP